LTEGADPGQPPARRQEVESPPEDQEQSGTAVGWFAEWRSGPLPEAAEYELYERTLPGTADRILRLNERAMDLTEREATHRHDVETKIVEANIRNQSRGQVIATFFGVLGFAAAIGFVATGRNVAAFVAILVPLGAFVSRFIRR
jgi:uncharacterized membrane protein